MSDIENLRRKLIQYMDDGVGDDHVSIFAFTLQRILNQSYDWGTVESDNLHTKMYNAGQEYCKTKVHQIIAEELNNIPFKY